MRMYEVKGYPLSYGSTRRKKKYFVKANNKKQAVQMGREKGLIFDVVAKVM